jgi:hypothetical protein
MLMNIKKNCTLHPSIVAAPAWRTMSDIQTCGAEERKKGARCRKDRHRAP